MTRPPPGRDSYRHLELWDRHLHAFVALAPEDEAPARKAGPLSGLTLGVKDIIDVAGLPTRCGSKTRDGVPPAQHDATAVASLRAAGAHILGKTTTTEFAFTDPTPCRNPHDLRRSPGGSSSGSGAAVAAGVVDIALGTQTAGSLCRPAAYCGIVGLKPTAGVLPLDGVVPLAPSFDTVGIMARRVTVVQAAFDAMAPQAPSQAAGPSGIRALCGLWKTDAIVQGDCAEALQAAARALAGIGAQTNMGDLPADVGAIVAAHRTVMCAEAAAAHGALLGDTRADLLGPKIRAALQAGVEVSAEDLARAKADLARAREMFWAALSQIDLVLTLPVPEGAPLLDGTTGFQDWLTPWTVFGGPLVSLPWGMDALSRPCAVMLAAPPGRDRWLLEIAARLESCAPDLPVPRMPA